MIARSAADGQSGGLRRDDLRRDGHRLGIESNARDIAGDGQLVRLTDRDGLARSDRDDADGRGRPVGSDRGECEPFDEFA